MPTDRLAAAIMRQEELVDEVRKLRTSNRVMTAILAAVVAALLAVAAFAAIAVKATVEARDANRHIAEVVAENETTRREQALESCRLRNNTPRALRDALNDDIDASVEFLIAAGTDEAIIHDYASRRRAIIPSVAETETDCDSDRRITAKDYPPS